MTTFNNNFPFPIPNYKRTGAFRAGPFVGGAARIYGKSIGKG